MTDFHARALLTTDTVAVWDVVCESTCRHTSTEECVAATHLVFPYRGTYVQHTGRAEAVAEPNLRLAQAQEALPLPYAQAH
jgi:AraC family transcriptional regulator